MKGLISVNGKVTTPDSAFISVLDRGFLFGDNIFEVFVGFGPTILDLQAHIDRLRNSAEMIALDLPWKDQELKFELEALLEATRFLKTYLRLVVTRGSGPGLTIDKTMTPSRIVYCLQALKEPQVDYQEGIKLQLTDLNHTRRGAHPKTGNYLTSITALDRAKSSGFDDILWVNAEEEVTEAATANIFFIGRSGDLVEIATPGADSGLLLGITRKRIIELLGKSQIPVTVRKIQAAELPRFDEAFLCSTVKGLIPISRIDNHKLYTRRPSSTFNHIERLYMTWVQTQVGYALDWTTGQPIS